MMTGITWETRVVNIDGVIAEKLSESNIHAANTEL